MVSVVIITKNEEMNLAECLESVQWANELIVVDAHSNDSTIEIAKKYTNKVFVRDWPGFGPQKNFGITKASSEWVLILDADERVSEELRFAVEKIISAPLWGECVAYRVARKNIIYGRWIRWGGTFPDYQIRLIQRGKAQYNDVRIHENLIIEGKIGTLSGHLIHYTERKISDHFKKFGLYTTLAAEEKRQRKMVVYWSDLFFRPLVTWTKTYLFKQGFRDGVQGFIVSAFASMYTFVKYAKVLEMTRIQISRHK